MYRAPGESDVDAVDFDALTEIVERVRRISKRIIVGSLLIGVALGVVAVILTLDTYTGPGGRALGARLGYTFAFVLGLAIAGGVGVRKLALRVLVPRWIDEMAAIGVNVADLRGALAPFVE